MLIGFAWARGGPSAFLACADWSGLGARVRSRPPSHRLWSRGRATGAGVRRIGRRGPEPVSYLAECKLVSFPVAIYKVLRTVAERIRLVILADNELQTLSGKFMTTFGHLRELRLEGNCLHGLPDEVGTLQHLQAIDLSRNQFQDFPERLTALQALETINLEENEIVDVPVEKLAAMASLKSVNLRRNPLNAEVRAVARPLLSFDLLLSPEGARGDAAP
uniref:Leucine rich repeat containing 20 n=2 Tax=Monodelphis domestica TaxID=13616 RepID=F7CYA3_MONDO